MPHQPPESPMPAILSDAEIFAAARATGAVVIVMNDDDFAKLLAVGIQRIPATLSPPNRHFRTYNSIKVQLDPLLGGC